MREYAIKRNKNKQKEIVCNTVLGWRWSKQGLIEPEKYFSDEACCKILEETADWPEKALSLVPHWFVKGIPFASFIGSHLATNESWQSQCPNMSKQQPAEDLQPVRPLNRAPLVWRMKWCLRSGKHVLNKQGQVHKGKQKTTEACCGIWIYWKSGHMAWLYRRLPPGLSKHHSASNVIHRLLVQMTHTIHTTKCIHCSSDSWIQAKIAGNDRIITPNACRLVDEIASKC